ncbi:MAG: dienelactone hydrolase family protein [Gammaproteobacteria bacterium]
MGETIRFTTPAGGTVEGWLARAPGSSRHIVVLQEWWGLNAQIRGVCERFAAAGFNALAPDLYAGRSTEAPDEAGHLMNGLDWVGATRQDVRGAVRYQKSAGGRCGVTGFCMGGALTVIAAVDVPEADAAVCWYGLPPAEQADPAAIRVPFQGHFANRDDWCTPAAADALQAAIAGLSVPHEIHRYDAAHGFFNEQRAGVHDPRAAALAWDRTIAFLRTHL